MALFTRWALEDSSHGAAAPWPSGNWSTVTRDSRLAMRKEGNWRNRRIREADGSGRLAVAVEEIRERIDHEAAAVGDGKTSERHASGKIKAMVHNLLSIPK